MRRIATILILGLAPAPWPASQSALEDPPSVHPDVVLIVVDDLAARLGCLGDPQAQTPNIDRLAGEGVTFARAYSQATSCNPSRTSFMSGLRPRSTGIFENRNWHELELVTLPEHFAAHGYETVKVGKVLHPMGQQEFRRGRGQGTTRAGIWSRALEPVRTSQPGKGRRGRRSPPDQEATYFKVGSKPISWFRAGATLLDGRDGSVAEAAARFLEEEHERPFLLAVGFSKPHLPFAAPEPYFERYREEDMVLPEVPSGVLDDVPQAARKGAAWGERPAPEMWRRAILAYYACVSYIDECVGRILEALRETGALDDTIVILMSDHGQLLGEHELWRKDVLFEDCVRVPLIVSAPGARRGDTSLRLVENVDVFPTLAELCGIPLPERCEGTSFVPLLTDPEQPWKKAAFSYEQAGTTLRTERWRYTEWASGEAELYDHASDPAEHRNLAASDEHAATIELLREMLAAGWSACTPDAKKH